MSQSEQINELSQAMAKAQGEIENATFNRSNPHFKSKYADLAAVWDAIRKPLSKNGLWISQTMERCNGADTGLDLVTTLRHSSGQWVSSTYPLPVGAKPQEFGTALTYARRYSLSAIVGIAADEDDDGNEAQKVESKPTPAAQELFAKLKAEVTAITSVVELGKWGAEQGKRSYDLPQDLQRQFRAFFNGRKDAIENTAADTERAKSEKVE